MGSCPLSGHMDGVLPGHMDGVLPGHMDGVLPGHMAMDGRHMDIQWGFCLGTWIEFCLGTCMDGHLDGVLPGWVFAPAWGEDAPSMRGQNLSPLGKIL